MRQKSYKKKKDIVLPLVLLLITQLCVFNLYAKQPPMKLWYTKPAINWMTSALPVGNGEFGGMFFGGVEKEQMQFNDKTLWTGSTTSRGAYQNFGSVYMNFPSHTNYTDYVRMLDLDNATGSVSYKVGGITYLREYFASNPDSVIVMRISTPGNTGKLTFSVELSDAHSGTKTISGNNITIKGSLTLLSYEAQVTVLNEGGSLTADANKISVTNANEVTILLTGATNFDIASTSYVGCTAIQVHNKLSDRIAKASAQTYTQLKNSHLADYQPKFERVRLDFGVSMPDISTDELVRSHRNSIYLDILYYQYGRYLMLGSSRGMNLPNNLQGLWNDSNSPAWQCDIHSNINIQMNYWPAENANLSECHLPFINYVKAEALKTGGSWQKMASAIITNTSNGEKMTGYRGWTLRTQSNIFGYSDWNWNRPANAWYCMHLWQHYLYTNDINYLKETAFPVMKSTCEFWFDRLKQVTNGKLVAPDEWSPEQGNWEDGVSYAQQLIWELFNNTLKAANAMGDADPAFVATLQDKFSNLDNGVEIGSWGQIKEWKIQTDVQGNNHRHLSHLIALYPGNQISDHINKTYADAARKTLISRGDGGTGWSRAWKISCWARLFDGDHAYKLLKAALNLTTVTTVTMDDAAGGVYENLLDAHPSFQIDGNFGATAGITEMLLQSNLGFIQLLPALPSVWPNGDYTGLKAEGDFTVDLNWKNSQPLKASIYSGSGNTCTLYYPIMNVSKIEDENGNPVTFDATVNNKITFPTVKEKRYTVFFSLNVSEENEIIPYVEVNGEARMQQSEVLVEEKGKLLLAPESVVEGTWYWTGPNGFTSFSKDVLFENISASKSGIYIVTHTVNGIKSCNVFSVYVLKKVFDSVNKIVAGDYFIKKKDTELYWTNTQVSPSGNPGGKPKLQELGSVTNPLAQVWTLSLDGGYYKLVSKADGRYVNEKGNFGTNSYYQDWNTFNVYNEGQNCAIQITQKSAAQEKGAWFFQWNASNEISYTSNTEIDAAKDLVFTFIPYQSTGIITPDYFENSVQILPGGIRIKSEDRIDLLIYNQLGVLLKKTFVATPDFIRLNPGIYFLKFQKGIDSETKKIIVY